MDICTEDRQKGKSHGTKKYSSAKDLKKKLSSLNKRIGDLHHQRKSVYKNSARVKRIVHNQINQIVRCFRGRERDICCGVDEIYFSQDANIGDELSRLQSIYTQCQTLFNHIENSKDKSAVLQNIDIMLSEVNLSEKLDIKPIEFLSDFEMMKVKASSYGVLEGDVKKDDFVHIGEENDHKLPQNCKLIQNKNCSVLQCDAVISNEESSSCKTTDSDDFQIIDLLDNMSCQDVDNDFVMADDENLSCVLQTENELSELSSSKGESALKMKECCGLKSLSDNQKLNIDFNPEEEWNKISEMNKKIASWHEMTSKVPASDSKEEKSFDKNRSPRKYSLLKDDWLYKSKVCCLEKRKSSDKLGIEKERNFMPPAEIIKKSFKPYLAKENVQNWLSTC